MIMIIVAIYCLHYDCFNNNFCYNCNFSYHYDYNYHYHLLEFVHVDVIT